MRVGRAAMGGLYTVAGFGHFLFTRTYERMMPAYLPAPHALVLLSGTAEIVGGLGVLIPGTQRSATWGLIALLVVVFPANLWMAQHPDLFPRIPQWALWLRLPLQVPLIWWAWRYTSHETQAS